MKTLYYSTWGKLSARPSLAVNSRGRVPLRVFACGICGSELETFKNASTRRTPPLILGHEFCGQVEEVYGEDPGGLRGRRMIPHAVVHCGQCPACLRGDTNLCYRGEIFGMHRPGAFAEYVAVPERVLIPWPENLSPDAAIFTEPLANGINALRQGGTTRRSKVAAIRAGPIGLMCLFAAKTLHQSSVAIPTGSRSDSLRANCWEQYHRESAAREPGERMPKALGRRAPRIRDRCSWQRADESNLPSTWWNLGARWYGWDCTRIRSSCRAMPSP